jgi:predicted alpha/beta-hydrolase family hydrolase
MPVLAFSGTRDPLCTRELMDGILEKLDAQRSALSAQREWVWIPGADHSFHVLKSSGRTDADVLEEVGEKTAAWASRLAESP